MKKVKISIPEEDFGTLNTKYPADSSKVSNDSFTAGTKNIETSVKGVITKRKGGVTYSTLPTPPRDQYEAIFSDGVRHLLTVDNGNLRYTSGDGNETLVLAGLTATLNNEFATTQDRVYFGNGIQKKVYDKQTNYGGQPYTFPTQTTKNMGAQAPSAALSGVGAGSGSGVAAGSYKYKVTFVYYDSEESNGGPESTVVTIGAPQDISLSSIPLGGYGVTQRKIYRASSTDSYTQYLLVAVISNNTATTTTDSTGTGLTSIPIDQGLPPDFTLISLYLDRLFVAGVAGDPYFIFYSEPGLPDIYPALNYIPCNQEDPITGIVVYLDRLIVFNRRSMGQILGKTSDQFRYAPIQGSIGCVDNRTIQTRVIDGVPVLVWLSDKGFYAYNGNSIVYISDAIEDQVNSNIQQSVIQKNRISHSDYAIFTAGTWSDGANPFTSDQTKGGINLEANQGTITTKGPYWDTGVHPLATYEEQTNPKKVFDTEDEWDDGTTKTNLAIYDLPIPFTDKMFPTRSAELNFSNGQHVGTYVDGIALKLTLPTLLSSETSSLLGGTSGFGRKYANRFIASASGVVTEASLSIFATPYSYEVWSSHPTTKMPLAALGTVGTVYVTAGQSYWIVANFFSDFSPPISLGNGFPSATTSLKGARLSGSGAGTWISDTALEGSYTIRSSGGPISGTWTSEILDSHALSAPTVLYQTASFPSGTGSVIAVQGSSDPLFNTIETSQQFNNQTTFIPLSLANKRYWRVVISLSSSTAGSTPTVQPTNGFSPGRVELEFPQTGTWESEVIDCTSDVSVYSALTTSSFAPGGFLSTSVTTKIATSTSPAGPWTFVTFGSHTVRQYVKLQIVMTKGRIAPSSTIYDMYPYINSLSFSWTVASTFISDEIDTGSTPSGWDIFQSSFTLNSGTVVFSMRSAASLGALSGATWYTVTNGEFPTSSLPTLQWVQWRAVITSTPDQVPTIDSVTIGWFVGTAAQGIRATSIFYDKNYYVSLAEFENDYNNIVFVLDFEGKWRVFRGLNIATLSYFFNSPYFGDAVSGNIVKFLEGTSDEGDPIELDVYTKAFDGSSQYTDNEDKVKVLDHVIVDCSNTGATFDCSYSVDGGETFNLLYDTSGNNSWTTGTVPFKYLRPRYTTVIPQGYSLMIRIHNNDTNEVEINSIKAVAFVREQPPIITG